MKMTKAMLPAGTDPKLADELMKVYDQYDSGAPKFKTEEIEPGSGVYKRKETAENKALRHELMKACLRPAVEKSLNKSSITALGSNFVPYDLQAPSHHLVPWLSPIRESLPRVKRPSPGNTAHWKTVIANSSTSYSRGGMPASPWVNNGQRAPAISLTALDVSASYVTIGKEGSVEFEAESASEGFEDALATAHFFTLETLMVSEEDTLLGGNKTLKLGTANKPVGSATGSGSLTGTYYASVIGLTYEGYRNFVIANGLSTSTGLPQVTTGLTQQVIQTTADGKVMTTNSGCGQASTISTSAAQPSSSASFGFSTTGKTGEIAWLWYVGTTNATNGLYLQALTTVPSVTFTAAPVTTTQLLSVLQTGDFSVNDGTTGGGANQVTAYDGLITQALNNTSLSPQNAYVNNLAGALLTTGGRGNVVEIDNMLLSMWNLYKVTVDVIYVNAQELQNITSRVLNTTSAPLLRYERDGDSDEYDLTGSGVISFYFNPFIPGGKKIPIIVHPTLPPGTILAYAKELPPYFKTSSTPVVAEVLLRRDYYAQEFALTSREWTFGTFCESVPAIYAPFCFGLLTGIGNG